MMIPPILNLAQGERTGLIGKIIKNHKRKAKNKSLTRRRNKIANKSRKKQ